MQKRKAEEFFPRTHNGDATITKKRKKELRGIVGGEQASVDTIKKPKGIETKRPAATHELGNGVKSNGDVSLTSHGAEKKAQKAERRRLRKLKEARATTAVATEESEKQASPSSASEDAVSRQIKRINEVNDVGSSLLTIVEGDNPKIEKAKEKRRKLLKKLAKGRMDEDEPENKSSTNTQVINTQNEVAEERASSESARGSKSSRNTQVINTQNAVAEERASWENAKGSTYIENLELVAKSKADIDAYLTSNKITYVDSSSTVLRPILDFTHLPTDIRSQSQLFATFRNPTPIQAAAWPHLLSGRDVVGVAETGSGKTLAFGVPCVRRLRTRAPTVKKRASPARSVVVSPTRELALQIYGQYLKLAEPNHLECVCVYGGVPKDAQRTALKTAHIIIATPGRLNDLISEGCADLSNVEYLVLDEADRMLDKGFEEDIRKIISACAPNSRRQTLMFTATWPPSVRSLAESFMRSPVQIRIGDDNSDEVRANTRIEQRVEVLDTNPRAKEARLLQLIRQFHSGKKEDRLLVFVLYKKEAIRVESFLKSKGLNVAGIHGDLSQERRTAALDGFKRGSTSILVATDVAARGLDIPDVKAVINVTFPLTIEDYVHRIGRTGRAGAEGLAITFFTQHDKGNSGALINVLKAAKQKVPEELMKFGTTVKKKEHSVYGAFYKAPVEGAKTATKITFDD